MNLAIREAKKAYLNDEVPVGAIIVKNNMVISKAYNKKKINKSSLEHAELICIKKASKKIGDWRLDECIMYVTMEPCLMCIGAIVESRIKKIVFGCAKPINSLINTEEIFKKNNIEVIGGILNEETSKIIKNFFQNKR